MRCNSDILRNKKEEINPGLSNVSEIIIYRGRQWKNLNL